MSVRIFVMMSYRFKVSSIGRVECDTKIDLWRSVICVPIAWRIIAIVTIDIPINLWRIVRIVSNIHTANPRDIASVIVIYMYSSGLTDTTIIIIINRSVFNLNDRSIRIILYIGTIIITRIKTDIYSNFSTSSTLLICFQRDSPYLLM